ncbi:MAG TPA: SPASM domain-containing protein [Gemmataceae bacterium]|jgi:hypothetical protein|nr:SPASM domain-containing protein [Gemmataceae bacterium]
MKLKRISYSSLNAKQKENFNFQKISAVLADYGFVTLSFFGICAFIAVSRFSTVRDYCEVPGQALVVNPRGEVKPCCGFASDLDQLNIGNIYQDSVQQIVRRARKHPYVGKVFREGPDFDPRRNLGPRSQCTAGRDVEPLLFLLVRADAWLGWRRQRRRGADRQVDRNATELHR